MLNNNFENKLFRLVVYMVNIGKKKTKKIKPHMEIPTVFSEKDYSSGDGMLTSVWGPSMWHSLHTISFNYPVDPSCEDKRHYQSFIMNLQNVLPCGKCRKNLKKNFSKLPLTWADMKSRYTFSKYIYNLHEVINTMLGKNSGLTYQMVRERYEHFRSRCTKSYKELKKAKLAKRAKTAKKKPHPSEKGCTEPLYGEKSKCVIQIIPQSKKVETFQVDKTCLKQTASSSL